MSQEQGGRLADMASQNSLTVEQAERSALNSGQGVTPAMNTVKDEAANLAARAADQLKGE